MPVAIGFALLVVYCIDLLLSKGVQLLVQLAAMRVVQVTPQRGHAKQEGRLQLRAVLQQAAHFTSRKAQTRTSKQREPSNPPVSAMRQ